MRRAQKAHSANDQLSLLYHQLGVVFWRAEKQLNARGDFRALAKDDPLRAEYSRAASAADAYLKIADADNSGTWTRPAVFYLGGLAKYSLGDEAGALQLLERLQTEFPHYQRDVYYSENMPPNPELSTPAAAGVSKLIFFLKLQQATKSAPSLAALQAVTRDALTALAAKQAYIALLVSRSIEGMPYYGCSCKRRGTSSCRAR